MLLISIKIKDHWTCTHGGLRGILWVLLILSGPACPVVTMCGSGDGCATGCVATICWLAWGELGRLPPCGGGTGRGISMPGVLGGTAGGPRLLYTNWLVSNSTPLAKNFSRTLNNNSQGMEQVAQQQVRWHWQRQQEWIQQKIWFEPFKFCIKM